MYNALHLITESIIAIPETINASSIAIEGSWERFNVTWAPARRVNLQHARVFYDVSLQFEGQFKIEVEELCCGLFKHFTIFYKYVCVSCTFITYHI